MTVKRKGLAFDATESQRKMDGNGIMHVILTNISKAAVNPYLGREIPDWQEHGLEPDEIYYAFRDPDELEKAAATFNGLPLLLEHDHDDAENPSEQRVGSTGTDAIFEIPYLKNSLSIQDQDAIDRVLDGSCKEISCAYKYTPDFTPGEFEGVAYDFVMREIEGNHVALVPEGRAGSDVVVADSKPEFLKNERSQNKMSKWKRTKARKLAKDNQVEISTMDAEEIIAKHFEGASDDEKEMISEVIDLIKNGEVTIEVEKNDPANDEDPDQDAEEKEETAKDGLVEDLAEALKDVDRNELWDAFCALANAKDEVKGKEIFEKIAAALKGETADEDLDEEDKDKAADDDDPDVTLKVDKEALTAQDAKRIQARAEKQVITKMRNLTQAAKDCAFLIGNHVDPMAYDSAEAIYALGIREMDLNPKDYHPAAYKGIVDAHRKQQHILIPNQYANDSAGDDDELEAVFKNLNRIKN